MKLSLVIPAYNEALRIGPTLDHVMDYLARQDYDAEIIVVDDGSTDGTAGLVTPLLARARPAVRLVQQPANRGKGAAVRAGMEAAVGAYRAYYDADGSTPIRELDKVWPLFDAGCDIVAGSRAVPDADVEVRQAPHREMMGRLNNRLLRAIGVTRLRDTQCGFKVFTARAAQTVFPRQTIERFAFDAEILYIARKHGLRVHEMPVHWRNDPSSRVRLLGDSTEMLYRVLGIRIKDLLGRYR